MKATEMNMGHAPVQREYLLEMLPVEAVTLILGRLGFRDMLALRATCRTLSEWTGHVLR